MRLMIEPLDVLFFRDGKPFVAGESHIAQSLFPPTALTFQGAVRTAILTATEISLDRFGMAQNGASDPEARALVEEIGDSHAFGRLRLRGPFIATIPSATDGTTAVEEWYPCPADVVMRRKEGNGFSTRLYPVEQPTWMSDLPENLAPLWAATPERVETASGFLISHAQLTRYLAGEVPDAEPMSAFVTREPRFGIKLAGGRKVVEEGMLYSLEVLRLKSGEGRRIGFIFDVEGTARLPDRGILALGGERRAATYERLDPWSWPEDREAATAIHDSRRFLLYVATPAIFTQEPLWLPDFIDPSSLTGTRGGVTIKVVAVAAGRPLPLGGWDLASNRPKPMQPAVPAGSVYWCEMGAGTGEAVVQAFHGQCLSSMFAEIGFGQTFVGRWPHV